MAFNVNDSVVCQRKGGQSGNKAISPPFPGTVKEVLGGGKYRVDLKAAGRVHNKNIYFKGGVVNESDMTAA